jgi:hypothetical protein
MFISMLTRDAGSNRDARQGRRGPMGADARCAGPVRRQSRLPPAAFAATTPRANAGRRAIRGHRTCRAGDRAPRRDSSEDLDMPDDDVRPADPPAAGTGADRPTAVRQVQGALGTSQGGAGARHAEPVLQPTGTPAPAAAASPAASEAGAVQTAEAGATQTSEAGAPQTAENTCRRCAGTGRMPDGSACPDCAGSGRVIETVGDA